MCCSCCWGSQVEWCPTVDAASRRTSSATLGVSAGLFCTMRLPEATIFLRPRLDSTRTHSTPSRRQLLQGLPRNWTSQRTLRPRHDRQALAERHLRRLGGAMANDRLRSSIRVTIEIITLERCREDVTWGRDVLIRIIPASFPHVVSGHIYTLTNQLTRQGRSWRCRIACKVPSGLGNQIYVIEV